MSSILDFATLGGVVRLIPSAQTNLVWIGALDQHLYLHGNGLIVTLGIIHVGYKENHQDMEIVQISVECSLVDLFSGIPLIVIIS